MVNIVLAITEYLWVVEKTFEDITFGVIRGLFDGDLLTVTVNELLKLAFV